MRVRIRYESHGIVAVTATCHCYLGDFATAVFRRTVIRKTILKASSLVKSGRYSKVSRTAGGIVYLAWLVAEESVWGHSDVFVSCLHVHNRIVKAHGDGDGERVRSPGKCGSEVIRVNSRAPVDFTGLSRGWVVPGTDSAKNEPSMVAPNCSFVGTQCPVQVSMVPHGV